MNRSLVARATALVLIALMAAPVVRATPREENHWTHEVHGFLAGDRWLRLELTSTYSSEGLVTFGAALYGAPLRTVPESSSFSAANGHGAKQIARTEPTPWPSLIPPPAEETWIMELQWNVTFDEQTATSVYRIGPDRVAVRFPRAWIDSAGVAESRLISPPIEIEINGSTTFVEPGVLATRQFDAGLVIHDLPGPLHDPRGFTDKWVGFRKMMEFVDAQRMTRVDTPGKARCTGKCLACAGGIMGTFGSSVALVATCGGALVTGGATAVGCVIAFIAHESAMLSTAAACGACSSCAASGGGQPGRVRPKDCCPCLGTPSCLCPSTCETSGDRTP